MIKLAGELRVTGHEKGFEDRKPVKDFKNQ